MSGNVDKAVAWDACTKSYDKGYAKGMADAKAALAVEQKAHPCTCHPDDNPPVPCAKKYALNECLAAPVAAPVQEWQDISTAPKDGTRILMGWGGMVVLGYWLDNSHTQWPWMGWKFEGMKALNGQPTYWMLLPALRAISGDTRND